MWKYGALLGVLFYVVLKEPADPIDGRVRWPQPTCSHALTLSLRSFDGQPTALTTLVHKASRRSHLRLVSHLESWLETQDDAIREDFVRYIKQRTASSLVASVEWCLDWVLWTYMIVVPIMVIGKLSKMSRGSPSSSLPADARPTRLEVVDLDGPEVAPTTTTTTTTTTTSSPAEERRRRARLAAALCDLQEDDDGERTHKPKPYSALLSSPESVTTPSMVE